MSTSGNHIRQLRKAAGLSQEDLAAALGVTRGAIGNWELDKGISGANLGKIARHFNCSMDWLAGGGASAPILTSPATSNGPQPATPRLPSDLETKSAVSGHGEAGLSGSLMSPSLSVIGTSKGKKPGFFRFSSKPADVISRPAALAGARDVYAFFIPNSALEPAHRQGDLRLAHPHRPCLAGDAVVLLMKQDFDGTEDAIIGILESADDETLAIRQLSPQNRVCLKRDTIAATHKILTTAELFGL